MIKRILILILILFINAVSALAEENFSYYLKDLRQEIDNKWIPPIYNSRNTSEVNFKIYKDGSIKNVKLSKSSKIKQLDKKAVETLESMEKFKALPKSYVKSAGLNAYVDITVCLTNYIKTDMNNIYLYKKKNNKLYIDSLPISTKLVQIKKVVYNTVSYTDVKGVSNFKDKMIKPELNIDIQRAKKNNKV